MKNYRSQEAMDDFHKAFQKKDKFFESFKEVFILEIYSIIAKANSQSEYSTSMEEAIEFYANDIINTAESVIDKDANFPEYRKQSELKSITTLMNKVLSTVDEDELLERLHHCSKQLITLFYPDIVNLSNYGFRLLERNTKMYSASFIANLRQKQLIDD